MNTDERLAQLLHDAVADVEPTDRLADIRARTTAPARAAARPWFYAAGATVLATAAAVAAFAVLDDDASEPGPADHAHGTATFLVPAYFIGDTPRGPRLFREFDPSPGHDELAAALARIQEPAADPDYRTPWSPGSFESVALGDGTIDVELGDEHSELPPFAGVEDLAAQQVVYTLQGALGEELPVRFLEDGTPVAGAIDSAPQKDVLSPVSISDPAEGNAYEGSFRARGRANSNEATVRWEIRDGHAVVREGYATASGWIDRLYPWKVRIDLSGLAPGTYTFVAMTDDPSGGAEGSGRATDTRTIVVR